MTRRATAKAKKVAQPVAAPEQSGDKPQDVQFTDKSHPPPAPKRKRVSRRMTNAEPRTETRTGKRIHAKQTVEHVVQQAADARADARFFQTLFTMLNTVPVTKIGQEFASQLIGPVGVHMDRQVKFFDRNMKRLRALEPYGEHLPRV